MIESDQNRRARRTPSWLTPLFACCLAFAALATQAQAQNQPVTKEVTAGGQLEIDTGAKIDVKPGIAKGIAGVVDVEGSDPAKKKLIYAAPRDIKADFSETLAYTVDGTDKTVTIAVSQKQPPTLASGELYERSFRALFVLFIIATVLESGLAVLFNWRPFLEKFDSRGVKTLVSVLVAYIFVASFDLDIVTSLMNVYTTGDHPVSFPGEFITALIIAGGSSAVNGLFISLGFRSVRTAEQLTPKPPKTEGWVSVALTRDQATGPVTVLMGDRNNPALARVISADANKPPKILRYFLKDPTRVPPTRGIPIPEGQTCWVKLVGTDALGNKLEKEWGPYPIAAGAIVDLELTL